MASLEFNYFSILNYSFLLLKGMAFPF
jgi:hypothetical protein